MIPTVASGQNQMPMKIFIKAKPRSYEERVERAALGILKPVFR
jgi:hypothetical protein